jgi:hypothetical protein
MITVREYRSLSLPSLSIVSASGSAVRLGPDFSVRHSSSHSSRQPVPLSENLGQHSRDGRSACRDRHADGLAVIVMLMVLTVGGRALMLGYLPVIREPRPGI